MSADFKNILFFKACILEVELICGLGLKLGANLTLGLESGLRLGLGLILELGLELILELGLELETAVSFASSLGLGLRPDGLLGRLDWPSVVAPKSLKVFEVKCLD
jgi:hypothetical protein